MKGPDATVHMSSTLTPLNKAVDTATARVECARTPVGKALRGLAGWLCECIAHAYGQAFLGQGFPGHPAPAAHEQLFSASKGGRELHITC